MKHVQASAPAELIRIAIPPVRGFVVDGYRVFVCSVELWTTFTGIRLLWPVPPSSGLEEFFPLAVNVDGKIIVCTRWNTCAIRTHQDMYVTTDVPIPVEADRLRLLLPLGDVDVALRSPIGV